MKKNKKLTAVKVVKKNFSLVGYDFLVWARDNVILLKNVCKYVGPYLLSQQFFVNEPIISFAAAGLGAWVLSVLEYWARHKVTIEVK